MRRLPTGVSSASAAARISLGVTSCVMRFTVAHPLQVCNPNPTVSARSPHRRTLGGPLSGCQPLSGPGVPHARLRAAHGRTGPRTGAAAARPGGGSSPGFTWRAACRGHRIAVVRVLNGQRPEGSGGRGAERPSGGPGDRRAAVPPPSRMRAREATLSPGTGLAGGSCCRDVVAAGVVAPRRRATAGAEERVVTQTAGTRPGRTATHRRAPGARAPLALSTPRPLSADSHGLEQIPHTFASRPNGRTNHHRSHT